MDIAALKVELVAGHPVTGAYDADDAVAAGQLHAVNCERDRTSMTGSEVLNAVDDDEWMALSDADKRTVWDIVHLAMVNPHGVEARLMLSVFDAAESPTIAALLVARKESVSRATEIGLGHVGVGNVAEARL